MRFILRLFGFLLACLCCGLPAMAQDADTFDIDGGLHDRQGTLQLAWPELGTADANYAGFAVVYAKSPLVVEYSDTDEIDAIVGSQFSTRLAGGRTFGDLFRLDIDLPVYPSVMVNGEHHFAMGDIRVGGLFPLPLFESDLIALGLAPSLRLPTANRNAYLTNGFLAGGLTAAAGGELKDLAWVTNLGLDLSKKVAIEEGVDQFTGSGLLWGAGVNYGLPQDIRVGMEFDGLVSMAGGFASAKQNPMEWHVFGSMPLPVANLQLATGVGSGIVEGIGAPKLRFFLGLSYRDTGQVGHPDTDGDGYTDDIDQCPLEPEDFDDFEDEDGCPDLDNDNDNILDVDDLCPNRPGPILTQGCPDTDGDGLADSKDACPKEAGPIASGGCPDRDGDRVPDFRDACPDDPADPRIDPARSDGCPSRVFVTNEKIEILDKIYFEVDKAIIKPVSFELLQEIAGVLNNNPDIQLVEVQGHTDSDASDEYNLDLSQRRAQSVVTFLVEKGSVDTARLLAKGFGETRPIDTNLTDEGKANNRRVEFVIVEQ